MHVTSQEVKMALIMVALSLVGFLVYLLSVATWHSQYEQEQGYRPAGSALQFSYRPGRTTH